MNVIVLHPPVRGIKFQRDADEVKFINYFRFVQDSASRLGKVFFLWAGEGRDITTDEIDGEDLSGWLVDESDADRFEAIWREPHYVLPEELDDTFCFARWSLDDSGSISIRFE